MNYMKKLFSYISEYMGILVLLVAVFALLFPNLLSHVQPKLINYLLGLVMFGMGLTLNLQDFKVVFSRPRDVIVGCLAQFTIMPLLAWGLSRLFSLDEALTLGVVLVGCCPGGTASNVITYLAKGDLALSVGMTGVSTLLAPFLTPLLTWLLAGKTVDVNIVSMFLSILWVVILPIVVGFIVKRLWPKFTEATVAYLPAVSTLAIAFIVAIIISANAHKLLLGGFVIVGVVMLHNLSGLGLGYLIGIERELHGKVVGTRTITLIAIGTTMYVLMSPTIFGGDNSRIIAQVVSGIGFLGAGIIFKDGDSVKGLTTAATVWCAAAVGGLCGFGMFAEAILGTLAIMMINIFFKHRLSKFEKEEKRQEQNDEKA